MATATVMSMARSEDSQAIARGRRVCRRITREYARTFYFASHCLPRSVREHAYAVYGFCRWADNGVDDAESPDDARRRVAHARQILDRAYSDENAPAGLLAFRQTVRARAIPKALFDALLDGMEMDLTITRYADEAALDVYCYRVAGVVGLMMTHVFGYRHDRCLPRAVELGKAMQLTNILRDIREDLERGRIYLPADVLARFGVDEDQLRAGRVDANFRELLRDQIRHARALYRASEAGIPDLLGTSSRVTVRVMGHLYERILDEIERLDYDVFRTRARVSSLGKFAGLGRCLRREWSVGPS